MQLRRRRTALALYAVLLVLPTVVLGAIQWRQISQEHERELRAVPQQTDAAAARLREAIATRFRLLLVAEEGRPFYHYAELYAPPDQPGDDLAIQASPLRHVARPPEGLLGWFSYNRDPYSDDPPELFVVPARGHSLPADVVGDFVERFDQERWVRWVGRIREPESVSIELAVAAVNRGHEDYLDCLEECYSVLREEDIEILLSRFHVILYRETDGTQRMVATRRAILADPIGDFPEHMHCLDPLRNGFGYVQGFYIEPQWLFDVMPRWAAASVLSSAERFALGSEADVGPEPSDVRVEIHPVGLLEIEVEDDVDQEHGRMAVTRSKRAIEDAFVAQRNSFLLLAAMLSLSLCTGMALLLRSVAHELRRAQERENFVASVTHELRTPLAAIRLLGEMLFDGWTTDPRTQREYHGRIVDETNRLSTLVERVLAKARISRGNPLLVVAGDLNAAVRVILPELEAAAGGTNADLELRLAEDLPSVLLEQEAVEHILVNLVENARKYAQVDLDDPGAERIVVETRRHEGRVVLEVADRGPGVPPEEVDHIFDAFYRSGNEATRTARGTGLGLHLVKDYADALGARVSVLAREGGGALFRVRFKRARETAERSA